MILLLMVACMQTTKAQYIMQVWKDGAMAPYVVNDVDSVRFIKAVTSIALSQESITIGLNETYQLSATVLPEDADVKVVEWESSDESVAQVSDNGMVTAVAAGTCTVTCRATDGSGVYAECQVTVTQSGHGEIGGHEYVDFGLPSGTLWATMNVGADNPNDYGNYYSWGETETRDFYDWTAYKYFIAGNQLSVLKYNSVDYLTELEPEDDAATTIWGEAWQIPSYEQVSELMDTNYVSRTYRPYDEIQPEASAGVEFTSKINGVSIFLPAAGITNKTTIDQAGTYGYYWSRTLGTSTSGSEARDMTFRINPPNSWGDASSTRRYYGLTIRPVCVQETPYTWPVTSIELKEPELNLAIGEWERLHATVLPSYAKNSEIVYESSDETVAQVSEFSKVTAMSAGTCTIICRALDGSGVYAECPVTVYGLDDAHEYVNLGLPSGTLWATCNIGAENPEDYGNYFAWGETAAKETFSWGNYLLSQGSSGVAVTKYNATDELTELLPEDDAATVNWGSDWQMPSKEQIEELLDENNTTTEMTENGLIVTSKLYNTSIFLPNGGQYALRGWTGVGTKGHYWSRTLYDTNAQNAYLLLSETGNITTSYGGRYTGKTIRPVRKQ